MPYVNRYRECVGQRNGLLSKDILAEDRTRDMLQRSRLNWFDIIRPGDLILNRTKIVLAVMVENH